MVQRPDGEKYAKAESLLSRGYSLPQSSRDQYLVDACHGDETLCSEISWLREILRDADDHAFDASRDPAARQPWNYSLERTENQYKLTKRMGECKAGHLYLATRTNLAFDDCVVLLVARKILRNHVGFAMPRQAAQQNLVDLRHPSIARFTEAGTLLDGRAFVALEFVAGDVLTGFCKRHALTLHQRIALFVKVCAVVQWLHTRLTIHGDLRPENILISALGEPTIHFFGIAGFTASLSSATPVASASHLRDLAYASPEQLEGKILSTSTDVYSLGLILHQLLHVVQPVGRNIQTAEVIWSTPDMPNLSMLDSMKKSVLSHWRKMPRIRQRLAAFDDVANKASRYSPTDRYQCVGAMLDDLASAAGALMQSSMRW